MARTASSTPHIIVAGAGLAGLSAARLLSARGIRTTVFDARDRVGGRVWTIRDGFAGRQHAEGGADLIDSNQDTTIALARELKLPLVPILKRGFAFYGTGARGRVSLQGSTRNFRAMFAPFSSAVELYRRLEGRWSSPLAQMYAHVGV